MQKTAYEISEYDWSSHVCSSDLNYKEPIHIKVFENIYTLHRQTSGGWKLISLDDLTIVGKTY